MKNLFLLSPPIKNRLIFRESDFEGIEDIQRLDEEPSPENIFNGLEALIQVYSQFCDTRARISDLGLAVERSQELFFNEGRTVQIGSFKITVSNLQQLENLIKIYREKLDISPEPKPFVGPVDSPDDLPNTIAV